MGHEKAVRTSHFDPALEGEFRRIAGRLELWKCQQCGQCTAVCPSARHGGLRIREVLERAVEGAIDLSTDQAVWQCTMCNSCSERCQLGADPAEVVTLLRNLAVEHGNVPAHFAEEAKLFRATGAAFPCTGMTKKMRKELGLDDFKVSDRALEDTKKIVSCTRLGRVALEK
jgi:heterodisulfide reductase subunit C